MVVLVIEGNMVLLSGTWNWEMQSDAVYCSDVMHTFPVDYLGTKGIVHPDDLPGLKQFLFSFDPGLQTALSFRMITTYGSVVTIAGAGIQVESNAAWNTRQEMPVQELRLMQHEKELDKFYLQQRLGAYAERVLDAAHWIMNTREQTIYFSDHFYRIHGVQPKSLNAHLHTFLPFVHPEDRDAYSDAIERSYRQQLPLHISYRILTPDRKERRLQLVTHWQYGRNGILFWNGVLADVSATRELVLEKEAAQLELDLLRHIMRLWEKEPGAGYWYLNTFTRKIVFSEGCYQLYGIRKKMAPAGLETFINLVHPEDLEMVRQAYDQFRLEHTMPALEFRVVRQDGKIRYIRQEGQALVVQEELLLAGTMQDITSARLLKKRALDLETRLALQEARWAGAEETGMGSWTMDIATGEYSFSEGLLQLLGLRQQPETMQKTFSHYVHPGDRNVFEESMASALQIRTAAPVNVRILRRGTGRQIRLWLHVQAVRNREYLFATLRDITEEQEGSRELLERTRMAEAVVEQMKDCAFLTDVHNNVLMWNSQSEKRFGRSRENVIGKNLFEVFPGLRNDPVHNNIHTALNGEEVAIERCTSSFLEGYHSLHMVPMKDEDGSVWGIVHLLHDVTREHMLQLHLGERLNYVESLVESALDRIIVLDRNMNYQVWNRQCEIYYGIPRGEVLGKNILEIFPDSIHDPGYGHFKRALKGETIHIPAAAQAAAGHFDTFLIPVKNDEGEVTSILWMVHDLGEIMEARHCLGEEHRLLNEAQAIGHIGSFAYDVIAGTMHFSDELYRHLGYAPGEVTPSLEHIVGAAHPEDRGQLERLLSKALEGRPFQHAWRMIRKGGELIHISGRCLPLENGDGAVRKLAGTLQDITEMKEAETAAADNRDLLLQTAQASPDAITIYDLENLQPVYINHRLGEWLGYTAEEFLELGLEGRMRLFCGSDAVQVLQFNEDMKRGSDGEVRVIEYCLLTRDGKPFHVRNRSKVFRRSSDGTVTHLLSILQDINEEIDMRHRLEERTRFLETVLDANIDRIMVMDKDLRILTWNRRCEEIYGFQREQVLHRSFTDIFPALAADKDLMDAMEGVKRGYAFHIPFRREIYRNGYSEFFFIPLKDESGNTYAILNLLHDITKVYEAQEQLDVLNNTLESKNRELAQKNEEITNFAFVASHDLKEPLRKLQTFSDWLMREEEPRLSANGRAFVRKMSNSVKRLDRLIDDILLLTRIHSDISPGKAVDLNAVLLRVMEELHAVISASGAEITMDPLPVLHGNDNQLYYLLKNLIDNALRYAGQAPLIRITATMVPRASLPEDLVSGDGDHYCLSVWDNGPGIDPHYHKKIFQVFQRLHQHSNDSATGMGLAICKKIMQNHNGFILLESKPGAGATFHCYFPVLA